MKWYKNKLAVQETLRVTHENALLYLQTIIIDDTNLSVAHELLLQQLLSAVHSSVGDI